MEIVPEHSNFLKTYSSGQELEYKGNSIIYDDKAKTFMYYYFPDHSRLFIIDGTAEETSLPQIKGKVRVICTFEDARLTEFRRFARYVARYGSYSLYHFCDVFFYEISQIIHSPKMKFSELLQEYTYYTQESIYEHLVKRHA